MCYSTQLHHLVLKLSHLTWLNCEPWLNFRDSLASQFEPCCSGYFCNLSFLVFEIPHGRRKEGSVLLRCYKFVPFFGIPV